MTVLAWTFALIGGGLGLLLLRHLLRLLVAAAIPEILILILTYTFRRHVR